MTNQTPEVKLTNAQRVWDSIVDLHNSGRSVTRKSIADLSGLKLHIVDDHVDRLVSKDQLRRLGAGLLELVEQFGEPRPISKTVLPNGVVKLEIGPMYLELTPKESMVLSGLFKSELFTMAEIESGNRALIRMSELTNRITELQRQVKALREKTGGEKQPGLFGDETLD